MKRLFAALMVLLCLSVASLALAQTNKPGFVGSSAYVPAPTPVPTIAAVPTSVFNGTIISTPTNQNQLTNQYPRKVRRHHKAVATPIPTPPNSGIPTGGGSVGPNGLLPK